MKGITELLKEIESRWDTKTGLALVLFVVVAGAIWIFGTVDLARIESWQWAVIGLLGLGITAYWRYRRFPRAPDGKVGFGVAIQYESTPEAPKIKADFADRLRALIQASDHLRHKFHFIEFGEHASRRFTETANPEQLVLRTNTHFLLFGTAKSRLLSAGPSFVVELKGIVRHGPLDAEAKRLFGNDFSGVLPSKVIVNESNSILAFEFAARQIDVVARYVMGLRQH